MTAEPDTVVSDIVVWALVMLWFWHHSGCQKEHDTQFLFTLCAL